MSMIPDEIIEQVRDAADLIGIIGEHVELKRSGSDYRGPCPFHGGTHRNLAVIPKKGMYYCFVCHEAGDVFTFFMKKLGMDYPTAVREVARRVGITIPERSGPTGPDPREPLFSCIATAADWFARQLRESPEAEVARSYLAGRQITPETWNVLSLGFAPRGRPFLDAMKTLGLEEPVLLEAGLLVKRDDGTVIPRFRGRLLFPIHDLRGRIVGFGGRILGEGEPKYLNSPDTPVFHKGQLLYNLHAARGPIRKAERTILVEGYFDVIRLTLAGVEEVVAPLGTGLTAEQAALLKRHTGHVVLLYDSDDAGLRATFRAGDELLRHQLRVSVATLPEGEDPDTIVQRAGVQALEGVLKDAVDVLERKIQILDRKGFFGTLPGRRRALDRLLPTIRAARDPITKELYLTRAAESANIRKESLEQELPQVLQRWTGSDKAQAEPQRFSGPLPNNREKAFLLLMLHSEQWKLRVLEVVDSENFEFPQYRAVFDALSENAPERLDETSARTLEEIQAVVPSVIDPDAMFDNALSSLEADRDSREIERLRRELPFLSEEGKAIRVMDMQVLAKRRNEKKPTYGVLEMTKSARRRGAPGT